MKVRSPRPNRAAMNIFEMLFAMAFFFIAFLVGHYFAERAGVVVGGLIGLASFILVLQIFGLFSRRIRSSRDPKS